MQLFSFSEVRGDGLSILMLKHEWLFLRLGFNNSIVESSWNSAQESGIKRKENQNTEHLQP